MIYLSLDNMASSDMAVDATVGMVVSDNVPVEFFAVFGWRKVKRRGLGNFVILDTPL